MTYADVEHYLGFFWLAYFAVLFVGLIWAAYVLLWDEPRLRRQAARDAATAAQAQSLSR